MKKALLLFVAFLLPVLIYLFLKSFGKNEFDVPVLYTDSMSVSVPCYGNNYKLPYHVPDSLLKTFQWDSTSLFTVVVFENESKEDQHERSIQLTRVMTEFKNEPLGIIHMLGTHTNVVSGNNGLVTQRVLMSDTNLFKIKTCFFLLNSKQDAVVIDKDRRIRGQYTLTKREDADRMIMEELNILFKRY
ncbi:MAG: hypothetical protein U0U09_17485 [Cyclobacteriaceae bacterium]